ncbi:hypothetical protein FGG22_gp011 [Mycobacterium phage Hammer]|uniref:Uncharacterized protein n=1 Tax=Mycobacterium phage Hammer TaxID=2922204 RepID=G1D1V1_9CAUD|nr:hypothetical protein FGG22_gp011 [Mycobacterium phage Hammer]AEK08752.1 hypothetical protein HAMMER_105 [Mycobacterium phage Hammer]
MILTLPPTGVGVKCGPRVGVPFLLVFNLPAGVGGCQPPDFHRYRRDLPPTALLLR